MKNNRPIVMIYKRTHRGDPGPDGVFGIHDCMGYIRNRSFDAVIGVGGSKPWAEDIDIALKVNWIGITPVKFQNDLHRGPDVIFEKFCLYDEKGVDIRLIAPNLYNYMYVDANRRVVMSYSVPAKCYPEIEKILSLANNAQPSKALSLAKSPSKKCK